MLWHGSECCFFCGGCSERVRKWSIHLGAFSGRAWYGKIRKCEYMALHHIHTQGWAGDRSSGRSLPNVPFQDRRAEVWTVPSLWMDTAILFQCYWNQFPSHDKAGMQCRQCTGCPRQQTASKPTDRFTQRPETEPQCQIGTRLWLFTRVHIPVFTSMLWGSTGLIWKACLVALRWVWGGSYRITWCILLKGSFCLVAFIKNIILLKQIWDKR